MRTLKLIGFVSIAVALVQCQKGTEQKYPKINAPVAEVKAHEITSKHGDKRVDNYFWLRNREDSTVVNYLKAENAYLDTMLAHTKGLQEKLFAEMKGRIKEKDESVPYKIDDYYYYSRVVEGGEYPLYCRKKGSLESAEEIIADGNELGKGHAALELDMINGHCHHLKRKLDICTVYVISLENANHSLRQMANQAFLL